MTDLTIVVPGRPLALGNSRLHWAARMRLVRDRRELAFILAQSVRAAARAPRATEKMRAEATVYLSGVQADPDNALHGLKPEIDALVTAGLLRGDRTQDVELGVRQLRAESRKAQRVVWTISGMRP